MVFDPTEPAIDRERFEKQNWKFFVYATDDTDLKEALPGNLPEPLGTELTMRVYVDADHVGDLVTQRSQTGF